MRLLRTFLILLSAGTVGVATSACAGEVSDSPEASTTTGVSPGEVEDPGEGGNVPGDPNTPEPGADDPGAGVGGDQSNPY
ncbi:MAG TPA: hypothetical protein VMY88_03050 [Acidimicrobiales bacterium]|nr:hypothetical protein [Acidimicrobiales bacterium]